MISRTTAPAGSNDADALRQLRDGAFTRRIEQSFGGQLLLQLLKGKLQRAVALRFDRFHQKLVLAARFVDVDVAARQDRHAVLRLAFQIAQRLAEAHAAQLRFMILEREVAMAAGGGFRSRYFARHPNVVELIAQQSPDARVQFGYRESFANRPPRQGELFHLIEGAISDKRAPPRHPRGSCEMAASADWEDYRCARFR